MSPGRSMPRMSTRPTPITPFSARNSMHTRTGGARLRGILLKLLLVLAACNLLPRAKALALNRPRVPVRRRHSSMQAIPRIWSSSTNSMRARFRPLDRFRNAFSAARRTSADRAKLTPSQAQTSALWSAVQVSLERPFRIRSALRSTRSTAASPDEIVVKGRRPKPSSRMMVVAAISQPTPPYDPSSDYCGAKAVQSSPRLLEQCVL